MINKEKTNYCTCGHIREEHRLLETDTKVITSCLKCKCDRFYNKKWI
jgi:hypothetical protein